MDSSLRQRFVTGAVSLPLLALLVLLGPWTFAAVLCLGVVLGGRELTPILNRMGWEAPPFLAPAAALAFSASLFGLLGPALVPLAAFVWVVGLVWLFVPLVPARPIRGPGAWLVHLLGALSLGLLMAFWARLEAGPWRGLDNPSGAGPRWVIYALALTFLCDTGAYLTGRRFGRRKLWVAVSPKKTWEGVFGGFGVSLVLGGLLALLFVPHLGPVKGALLGGLVGVVGPFGDLIESRLKRKAMVKDAGALFPGHGGMLDRLDSLLYVAPLFYYGLSVLAR
jgi:phosphatidate cytidylyltransferase